MAQMKVEGVAYRLLKVGASARPPELRIATPVAVPLVRSSNFDCSQVRVPSAKATALIATVESKKPVRMEWGTLRRLRNVIPRFKIIRRRGLQRLFLLNRKISG